MDVQGKCLADNDRYAFLLGSALRNEDSDQFFSIYDSIIPEELPEEQVEKIKEQARFIADLPEDEFTELVLNARDFSLARGRPPPSPLLAMSTNNGQAVILSDLNDDDDDNQALLGSSLVTKFDLNAHASPGRVSAPEVKDDDSGLPSSTKTGRPTSLSSEDMEMEKDLFGAALEDQFGTTYLPPSGMLKRKGVVDDDKEEEEKYRDNVPRPRDLVVVSHSYKPSYDEAVAVEQDEESIESPHSDASSMRDYDVTQVDGEEGVEMTTFSSQQHGYYDEEDNDDNLNLNSSLCSRANSWRLVEPPCHSSTAINFSRSNKLLAEGKPISSLRSTPAATSSSSRISNVDDSVDFSLGGFSAQSKYSSDHAGALSRMDSPPFGSGKDLLSKVGESVSSLVKGSFHSLGPTQAVPDSEETSKKKQKQKTTNKGKLGVKTEC